MKIFAVVTDYIKASLLTTKGDIIKHDGVSAKKFPFGCQYGVLRVNAAQDDLEYIHPAEMLSFLLTKGAIIKFDGSYARQILIGTAGQVLRVNSVPDDLEYQDPGRHMFERIHNAKNIPDVDLAAGGVTVLDIDMSNVLSGDFFMIWGSVSCLNTGSATGVYFELLKGAGTATHIFNYDATLIKFPGYCENANSFHANLATFLKITGDGTFTLRVKGVGSTDCQVGNGNCQLYIHQVRQPLP